MPLVEPSRRVAVALLVAGLLAWPATAEAQLEGTVVGVDLRGVVDPFVAGHVAGAIADAERSGAVAVLLSIDTPGGLDSSMRQIVQAILNSTVPVICYVSPEGARAASAGTFILLACPVAAMAPATNVGAAHPVGLAGAIESEKAENDAAEYIVAIAERRGRNAAWAERAVRDSVSASAQEALKLGVIDLVAPDVPALLRAVDGRTVEVAGGREVTLDLTGAVLEPRAMGIGARILHALLNPTIAFLAFWLGLALLGLEFFVPGGIAGTLGALLLALSLAALGMLPVELIGVGLLVASVAFFALELVHPGVGLPTVAGAVALVLGGLLLFDPSVPSARVSLWAIVPVAVLATLFFTVVVRAAIRIRRAPPAQAAASLVGRTGRAVTALEPRGVVQVAGEEWTAEATGGARVQAGTRVRVVAVDGLHVRVEPAPEGAPAVPGGEEGRTA